MDCLICARNGDGTRHPGSVGGNIYEDRWWYAYHAPSDGATLGQLFLVSRRHFLDYAEMTDEESAHYGQVLRALTAAIRQTVDAVRVYVITTIEGVPHFHAWLIPRPATSPVRGWAFVTSKRSCTEADALRVSEQLRCIVSRR